MMSSGEYWAKRFESIENSLNKNSRETYSLIEAEIKRAQSQINADIEKWYYRIADNNDITLLSAKKLLTKDQLEEFQWSVEEYIKIAKENELNGDWIKELENASAKVHISRLEALKISTQQQLEKAFGNQLDNIDDLARKTYTDSYYKSIYEVQKGFSVGFEVAKVDEKKLNKIIASPWATDGRNFSNRVWQNKTTMMNTLQSELTRACILGGDPKKAIANMQKYVNRQCKNAKYVASRLVYTEQAYFASEGQKQAFKELDVEEYEIVSTLDKSTSKICQEMDGKHYKMSEFVIGATAPPFHPFCRTVTVPYFDDEFTEDELRASRGESGKTETVPANMKYGEWYDKYVVDEKITSIVGVETSKGVTITGVSNHALERMEQRNITSSQVINSLTNPLSVGKIKEKENGISQEYIGDFARVTINPNTGNVITLWKTSTKIREKLKGG